MTQHATIKPMAQRLRLSTDLKNNGTALGIAALASIASIKEGRRVSQREITLRGLLAMAKEYNEQSVVALLEEELQDARQ